MEAPIAVDDKAEQVEVHRPRRQPFELIDGVIADHGIRAWRLLEQALEGGDIGGLQMGTDHRDQPLLFRRERLANQLLQHGITKVA
jgi:hypothetical protein